MLERFRKPAFYYQYYASIHWTTCEECLQLHGAILRDSDDENTPPLHENCRCHLLRFPRTELKERQGLAKRMETTALQEIERRELLAKGIELIGVSNQEALELIKEAVYQEIYVPEIERLLDLKGGELSANPEWADQLMRLLIKIHKFKYDKPKYEHMPPAMQQARVEHGESLIKASFSRILPSLEERI